MNFYTPHCDFIRFPLLLNINWKIISVFENQKQVALQNYFEQIVSLLCKVLNKSADLLFLFYLVFFLWRQKEGKLEPKKQVRVPTYVRKICLVIRVQKSMFWLTSYLISCCFVPSHTTLWLRLNYYTPKMRGHRWQWISHEINIRHPGQLKKLKSWGPFWSYQLNSTANLAHLPQNWAKLAKLAVLFIW